MSWICAFIASRSHMAEGHRWRRERRGGGGYRAQHDTPTETPTERELLEPGAMRAPRGPPDLALNGI